VKEVASTSVLALIFLALFVPTAYAPIKIAILLIGLGATTILLLKKDLFLNRETLLACGAISVFGLANSMHGQFNNNPGAFRVLTVISAWPVVYGYFSVLTNQGKGIVTLSRVLFVTLAFLVTYSFLFLGYAAGFVPGALYIELDQGQGAGFYEGFTEYKMYSISSLLFLVPFALHRTIYLHYSRRLKPRIILLLSASVILVFMTGRRAVQLVVVLTPIMIYASHVILRCKFKKSKKMSPKSAFFSIVIYLLGILGVVYLLGAMGSNTDVMWSSFSNGFDFEQGKDASVRAEQFYSLMNGWLNSNLLFGVGNGGSVDLIRSEKFVWAYELTYVYLLFSTGIIGVTFYFGWFAWGLVRIRKGLELNPRMASYVTPMITGVFGLGIGAVTNPYFGKFDYLWIIMMPHLIAGGIRYQIESSKMGWSRK